MAKINALILDWETMESAISPMFGLAPPMSEYCGKIVHLEKCRTEALIYYKGVETQSGGNWNWDPRWIKIL